MSVAIEMMIQEDFSHVTSRLLALYSCSQFLYAEKGTLLAPVTSDNKPVLDEGEDEYVVSRAGGMRVVWRSTEGYQKMHYEMGSFTLHTLGF